MKKLRSMKNAPEFTSVWLIHPRKEQPLTPILEIDVPHVGGGPWPLALHLLPLLRGSPLKPAPQPLAKGPFNHLAAALQHCLMGNRKAGHSQNNALKSPLSLTEYFLTASVWQSAARISPRNTSSAWPVLPRPLSAQFRDAAATRDGGVPRNWESHTHMEARVSLCRRSVDSSSVPKVPPRSSREARKCGRKSWGVTAAVSQRRVARMRRSVSWWRWHGRERRQNTRHQEKPIKSRNVMIRYINRNIRLAEILNNLKMI